MPQKCVGTYSAKVLRIFSGTLATAMKPSARHKTIFAASALLIFIHEALAVPAFSFQVQNKKSSKMVQEKCAPKFGITKDKVKQMAKGDIPDEPASKCYVACIMENAQTLKDGRIDYERMKTQAELLLPEPTKEETLSFIKACSYTSVGEDKCEVAYNYLTCVKNITAEVHSTIFQKQKQRPRKKWWKHQKIVHPLQWFRRQVTEKDRVESDKSAQRDLTVSMEEDPVDKTDVPVVVGPKEELKNNSANIAYTRERRRTKDAILVDSFAIPKGSGYGSSINTLRGDYRSDSERPELSRLKRSDDMEYDSLPYVGKQDTGEDSRQFKIKFGSRCFVLLTGLLEDYFWDEEEGDEGESDDKEDDEGESDEDDDGEGKRRPPPASPPDRRRPSPLSPTHRHRPPPASPPNRRRPPRQSGPYRHRPPPESPPDRRRPSSLSQESKIKFQTNCLVLLPRLLEDDFWEDEEDYGEEDYGEEYDEGEYYDGEAQPPHCRPPPASPPDRRHRKNRKYYNR